MMRKYLKCQAILALIMLWTSIGYSQTIKELMTLHEQNLKDLYATRGAPPSWVQTGHVDDNYLSWCISHYNKPTAILIYSFTNDTLGLRLFDQNGDKHQTKIAITKNELTTHVNNVNLLMESSHTNLKPQLRGSKAIRKPKQQLQKSFKLLNRILLPKAFELELYEHLIIVPVLNISTLPLAAFTINDKYLIDYMSYSIAPSLFELMVSDNINKRIEQDEVYYSWTNALLVANPSYPRDSIWDFPDLPGTLTEIQSVKSLMEPENFTLLSGKDATKTNVTASICDFDLLYFATHGISNAENPMENSFLVLAEDQSKGAFLSLKEIMNWRYKCSLKADLVVLSACNTGLGQSHEGGIIGLARSFQIAGANHVVMSLWSIDDKETSKLMSLFFAELKEAKTLMPHEALRSAILNYKENVNDHPKYWAAFSIFGVPY